MDFTRMLNISEGLSEPYEPPEPPRLYGVQESKELMDFDGFLMDFTRMLKISEGLSEPYDPSRTPKIL